ncbi:hypothetical protein SAMN05421640_1006 [Ekhidna lutea]|uniref:Uncharacterized protein n=1 Tax=Ekhidna lutea TaxID=447679 RepID=A0A239GTS6_EKHLU|nr:hypothetical protein [Ekhidna lutea]SNS72619.1 hypothetical protein SAMN05421640_1006 [Ekhidna lutea]
MRLPIIKHTLDFIEQNDEDYVVEAVELLEHMAEAKGIKDEELDVIGELLSNFYGSLEVAKAIKEGKPKKEAMNEFMERVMGSIN